MSMEWEDLDPIVKTVPWAKASISVNTDGKPRMTLSFSEPCMKDCGHPEKANIMVGFHEGKVLVRLVWTDEGKFEVKALEKGGARVHGIPIKAPVPDGARDLEACEVERKDAKEAIFILPMTAWAAQLNQPPKPAAKPTTEAPKHPAPAPVGITPGRQAAPGARLTAIDAATYLRAKGVRCSRMAGDWWTMDGTKSSRMDVLARVNEFRRKSDLPSLGLDQIE